MQSEDEQEIFPKGLYQAGYPYIAKCVVMSRGLGEIETYYFACSQLTLEYEYARKYGKRLLSFSVLET
jgi:hypothetical protein